MPPKKIIELQQKTLFKILENIDNTFPPTTQKEIWVKKSWENICFEFGDSSTIFNSLQHEWVELENEDGDKLSAFDTENLEASTDVKLILKVDACREAHKRLGRLWLHSAVYTFSCFAEGHAGHDIEMSESARKKENKALEKKDLEAIETFLKSEGANTTMYCLKTREEEPDAFVLHVRDMNLDTRQLFHTAYDEMCMLGKGGVDTTFLNTRRNKVMNKLARYNFNIGDRHQNPDIANGKNTLYSFDEMPEAKCFRAIFDGLAEKLNLPQMKGLLVEANLYYKDTCGIRYHGDEERPESPVIGVNFGATRYLDFRSFYRHAPFGPQHRITLNHGDVYFMSRHAVGLGWCKDTYKRVIFRHRAGSLKFLKKHDKELEARARRKLEKRAKKKRKVEAQREAVLEAEAPVTLGRIANYYNDPALLCHGCNNYQRQVQNLVWYDTGGDGEQYCFRCDAKNKENKEQ